MNTRPGPRPHGLGRPLFLVFSWSVLIFLVCSFIWGADRGFDFTDESFALLSYRFPHAAPPGVRQFQLIVEALTFGRPLSVAGYRVLGLTVQLLGSFVMMWSFLMFLDRRLPQYRSAMPATASLYAFGATAGLLGLTWLPRAISYNSLATVLGELVVAAVLVATSIAPSESRHPSPSQLILASVAGAMLVVLLFTKFSAAVALAALAVAFLLLVADGPHRGLLLVVALGMGALATILLSTTDYLGGPFSLQGLREGVEISSQGSHSAQSLLAYYIREAAWIGRSTVLSIPAALLGLTFAAPVVARLVAARHRRVFGWTLAIPGPVVTAYTWRLRWFQDHLASHRVVYMILAGVAFGSALAATASTCRHSDAVAIHTAEPPPGAQRSPLVPLVAVVLLLVALPPATSLGTNNSLFRHATNCGAPFACLMVLAWAARATQLESRSRDTVLGYLPLFFATAMFAVLITLGGALLHPFGVLGSISRQTEVTSGLAGLSDVRVNPATARMLTELQAKVRAVSTFRPGDPLIAGVGLEGVAYALGGWLPGTEFYNRDHVTCTLLERVPDDLARIDIVIRRPNGLPDSYRTTAGQIDDFEVPTPSTEIGDRFDDCLPRVLPGYPDHFAVKARVTGQYGEVIEILVRRRARVRATDSTGGI